MSASETIMLRPHQMQLSSFPFALSSNFSILPDRVQIAQLAVPPRDQCDARRPSCEPAYHDTYLGHFFHLFSTHRLPHQCRLFQSEFLLINDTQLFRRKRPPILALVLTFSAQSDLKFASLSLH